MDMTLLLSRDLLCGSVSLSDASFSTLSMTVLTTGSRI